MAKDPAFLFYSSDFLTGVIDLSMKERGQYITLICLQHQRGHLEAKEMQRVVGKVPEVVLRKFAQDENGLYFNARVDEEIQKRESHCQRQRENVARRWNKNGTPLGNTAVLPLENENENEDGKETDCVIKNQRVSNAEPVINHEILPSGFEAFWDEYPKKVGKQAAVKAYEKIPASVKALIVPAIKAQRESAQWKKEGGRYIPNPTTWLNQGRWDDEVKPAAESAGRKTFTELIQEAQRHEY